MIPQFDPSKLDPQMLMELSRIVQQLPPHQIQKMQTLMHNMMAGFDVKQEMDEFEKTLPPGFREQVLSLMMNQPGAPAASEALHTQVDRAEEFSTGPSSSVSNDSDMSLREARLTILRAVSEGRMSPEDAESVLFSGHA